MVWLSMYLVYRKIYVFSSTHKHQPRRVVGSFTPWCSVCCYITHQFIAGATILYHTMFVAMQLLLALLLPLVAASQRLIEQAITLPLPPSNGPEPQRISGYFKLDRTHDARMFYFLFQNRNLDPKAPVVLWMTGAFDQQQSPPVCATWLSQAAPGAVQNLLCFTKTDHSTSAPTSRWSCLNTAGTALLTSSTSTSRSIRAFPTQTYVFG